MLVPLANPKTNLPAPTMRFIGRRKEIAALTALLDDPEIRMVRIFASGGMGKTQLALAVAGQLIEQFADGVYLVTVSASADAKQLATMIADIVGFQFQSNSITQQQQLLAYLRQKNILLLIDNAEYLTDSTSFFTSILQTASRVKILTTSRTISELSVETLFPLGGLDYQQEQGEESLNSDAMELFLHRAKTIRPDLHLMPQFRQSLQKICKLTRGMPLAIVFAASWLTLLTPEEIVLEIQRGLDLLETDLQDVPERQRSLRIIFDYTWKLITETEQHVLMKLSIFQSGFTREAAQTVAQGSLHNLRNLLRIAVVQPSFMVGRYELHELLRQYALGHLQNSGEYDAVLAAHGTYYLNFVSRQEVEIKGKNQLIALDLVQADIENLNAAWEWAAEEDELELLSNALEGLFWYVMMRSRYLLFEAIQKITVQRFANHTNVTTYLFLARFRLRYWWMQRWREGSVAKYPEVLDELESYLQLFEQFNLQLEIALCQLLLGDAVRTLSDDLERAQSFIQSAYDMFTALDDKFYAAWALHFSAKIISDTQEINQGFELLQQSLVLRRSIGDQNGITYSLYNLSINMLLLGQAQACEQVTHEILDLSRSTNEPSGLLMAQITLSLLALFRGHLDDAREQVEVCHKLAHNLNHGLGIAWTHTIRAVLGYFDGNAGAADIQMLSGEIVTTQAFLRYFIHWASAFQDDEDTARRHLLSALRYAYAVKATGALVWCLPPWAAWEARYGDPERATSLLALTQLQPTNLIAWLPVWLDRYPIQRLLEAKMGSEVFNAAYERGQGWLIEHVVASFLTSMSEMSVDVAIPSHIQQANQQLVEPLSDRELEVLNYIAKGLSNREIADELVVELSTVKKHLTHVYGKLGVNTRTQAILYAQQLQLV